MPKLSPCLLKYTAKQGHIYPVLRNSSQFFLQKIIVRLIWNGNTLRLSSKSTIFKQKIYLNCSTTIKFQDGNGAHAHYNIWSCLPNLKSVRLKTKELLRFHSGCHIMTISLVLNRNVVSAARDLVPTSKKPLPFTN